LKKLFFFLLPGDRRRIMERVIPWKNKFWTTKKPPESDSFMELLMGAY